jgi:hypothetical protein
MKVSKLVHNVVNSLGSDSNYGSAGGYLRVMSQGALVGGVCGAAGGPGGVALGAAIGAAACAYLEAMAAGGGADN